MIDVITRQYNYYDGLCGLQDMFNDYCVSIRENNRYDLLSDADKLLYEQKFEEQLCTTNYLSDFRLWKHVQEKKHA